LLHVSSIAAIGKSDQNILTEKCGWPDKSVSVYSRTKTLGELEVWRGIAEKLNAVIINPSVILGAGHWQNSSARIFNAIYKGLNYYTLGETGFIDVQDVISIMIALMKSEVSGERFILNAENLSYKLLFDKIADALHVNTPNIYASPFKTSLAWKIEFIKHLLTGKEPRVTKQSAKTSHKCQNYSSEKIRKTIGVKFQSIENTINRIANSYLEDIRSKNQS
jgi:nucleoside-diphosphate-sugar epimerase